MALTTKLKLELCCNDTKSSTLLLIKCLYTFTENEIRKLKNFTLSKFGGFINDWLLIKQQLSVE